MDMDSKLFQTFGQETELPASVRARLGQAYAQIRKLSGEEMTMNTKKARGISRTLLIAAILASLLTISAFAAVYANMNYKLNNGEDAIIYFSNGHNVRFTPALVLSFDVPNEGYKYFVRPDWLPMDAVYTTTASQFLYSTAGETVRSDPARGLEAEAARLIAEASRDGKELEARQKQYYREQAEQNLKDAIDQEYARLVSVCGIPVDELDNWYCTLTNDGAGGELPYIISVTSPGSLYGKDLLLDGQGGQARVIEENEDGEWYILKISMDYSDQKHWVDGQANYVFRFNQAEGYLLTVSGTSDFEILDRIMDHLQVAKFELLITAETDLDFNYGILDIGRG